MTDDYELQDRIKRLRSEMSDLGEAINGLSKKKANTDDLEAVSRKLGALEEETRLKYASAHSDSLEVRQALRQLLEAVEALRVDLSHHKRDTAEELKFVKPRPDEQQRFSTPIRFQMLLWFGAGIGLLAVMQGAPQALLSLLPGLAR
jgi:DNA repair exonuclease SbcCD ATPase subunit